MDHGCRRIRPPYSIRRCVDAMAVFHALASPSSSLSVCFLSEIYDDIISCIRTLHCVSRICLSSIWIRKELQCRSTGVLVLSCAYFLRVHQPPAAGSSDQPQVALVNGGCFFPRGVSESDLQTKICESCRFLRSSTTCTRAVVRYERMAQGSNRRS